VSRNCQYQQHGLKKAKMKNLSALSFLCAATLVACGGGGGGSTPAPAPAPASTAATGSAIDLAKTFFTTYDTSLATSIPASGTSALALTDGCSLNNGFSKTLTVVDYDADALRVSSRQYEIGATRTGLTVNTDRTLTNADGTTRREIDVQYVINYLDGTKDEVATQTLISGSSSGSTMADGTVCTTPDNKADLRFYGNRKIVNTFVNASNERVERTVLATGLAQSPAVVYNRFISLVVRDPANVATYATISGPGIKVAGVDASLKLVSPRLLRSAPEFAGKLGNYVDWKDTESFSVCRSAPSGTATTGNYAAAETADCVANGASGTGFGSFTQSDPSVQDTNFNALGVQEGGLYTVKVYAGDGWKTVNGQAGVTPIATYSTKLEHLPISTVALAGTLAAPANKFPLIASSSLTAAQAATAILAKNAFSVNLTWSVPGVMPDGRATALSLLSAFETGKASSGTSAYPASRQFSPFYPTSKAVAATLNVPPAPAALVTPTYGESKLEYTNRNGNFINTLSAWQ
jgi:hypothetical protein